MKKWFLITLLALATGNIYAQSTPVELNDHMVDITDKVYEHGEAWGAAFKNAMDTQNWSDLKPIRQKMEYYIATTTRELGEMKDIKNSKALKDAMIAYLNYEGKMVRDGFTPFERFDGDIDNESLKNAIDKMVAMGDEETVLLEKLIEVQDAYAKANGFKVAEEAE